MIWRPLFKFSVVFIITVIGVVLINIFSPRLFFNALVKKDYVEKEGYSETVTYSFKVDGCYTIGIMGRSKKMNWHVAEGKYKIEFLDSNGTLIDTVDIEKSRTTSVHKGFRTLGMYIFEIPFKGRYRDLNIRYTILEPDDVLQSVDKAMVLYVRKAISGALICGEAYEKKENTRTYGIKTYTEKDPQFAQLFTAIKNKDFMTVKTLFDSQTMSPDINMPGNRQPIHYAAYYNDEKTVRYLIGQNVDLNPKDSTGYTPIQYAIANNHPKIVEIILDGGVDIKTIKKIPNILDGFANIYDQYDLFFYSVSICSCELTQIFINRGMNIKVVGKSISDKQITLVDFLNIRKCRYDFDSNITDVTIEEYQKMKNLLIMNGAKESPARLNPVYIGRKEK